MLADSEELTVIQRAALVKAQCASCHLCHGNEPLAPVHGNGAASAVLAIVGEMPGAEEVYRGVPFSGTSGQILWEALGKHDIDRASTYTSNALLCSPDDSKAKASDFAACAPRLQTELAMHFANAPCTSNRVILCAGSKASEAVLGHPVVIDRDNGHSTWIPSLNAYAVCTYNPAALLYSADLYPDFAWAIGRAIHLLRQPYTPPVPYNASTAPTGASAAPTGTNALPALAYITSTSPYHAAEILHQHAEELRLCAVCDLETTGLNPRTAKILDIGIRWCEDTCLIISADHFYDPMLLAVLESFMGDPDYRWVYHNGKFDTQMLKQQLGIPAHISEDTMLLHHMLDERSGGDDGESSDSNRGKKKSYHGLKVLATKYCNAPHYEENIDAAHMAQVPPSVRHPYLAADLLYTYKLATLLREELAAEPPSREGFPSPLDCYEQIVIPATNALTDIELRGIRIDTTRLASIRAEFDKQVAAANARVKYYAAPFRFHTNGDLNPGSTIQMAKILYDELGYHRTDGDKTKTGRSCNKRAIHEMQRQDLAAHKPPEPLLSSLLEYHSVTHQKHTYLDGLESLLDANSRLHTSFLQHGTTSGRLSSRSPNLQNVPTDSVLRTMYVPTPGYTLVEADYEQLEVRVCAWYSRDPQLIADLASDDFHWNTAQLVFPALVAGLQAARGNLAALEQFAGTHNFFAEFVLRQARPEEATTDPEVLYAWLKKRLRRQTKFCTFGIIYGRGAQALADIETGLGVPVSEAAEYKRRWVRRYSLAIRWLTKQARLANRTGWVESASGRRRRFPWRPAWLKVPIDNMASNMPVQNLASEICLMSLTKLEAELPAKGLGNVLLTVHDSILAEIRTDCLAEGKQLMRHIMENTLTDDEITFAVEIKSGSDWGNCHD